MRVCTMAAPYFPSSPPPRKTSAPTRPDRPVRTDPGPAAALLAPAASAGFRDAAAYDAHRPAYPAEAVGRLLGRMRLSSSSGETGARTRARKRVVEVAAGTGKMTEALAAWGVDGEEEGAWLEVLASEPHPEMRRALEAKALRGVVVRGARAEELSGRGGVEEGWGDGVVAAQAFHW